MSGTTACPHCGTRFKVSKAELAASHGMARCGRCLQTFNTRTNFAPEEDDPQLELPIIGGVEAHTGELPTEETKLATSDSIEEVTSPSSVPDNQAPIFMPDASGAFLSKRRSRFWSIATAPLLLLMLAQAAYLFRVELAAHLPDAKPIIVHACQVLECDVPLPQNANLMSIESSELTDDPAHENRIILNALLRNRANYTQAFPNLELTLTASQDKALARRAFKPKDYLPESNNASTGLLSDQELAIKLRLDTSDLKPVGYRLVLFY